MGALVEEKIKRSFILDEIKLRKLVDIIEKRLGEGNICNIEVRRGDIYSYKTKDINDVVNEDNDGWSSITKLIINADRDNIQLSLEFKDGLFIYINGEDRDKVFLLYSDLIEYIKRNIITRVPTKEILLKSLMAILMITTLFLLYIKIFNINDINEHCSNVNEIIKSNDINYKLNFIIKCYYNKNELKRFSEYEWVILILLPLLILLISLDVHEKIIYYFFPQNAFLFGVKKEIYNKRRSYLRNFFWVVVVGGLVAFLINILSSSFFQ